LIKLYRITARVILKSSIIWELWCTIPNCIFSNWVFLALSHWIILLVNNRLIWLVNICLHGIDIVQRYMIKDFLVYFIDNIHRLKLSIKCTLLKSISKWQNKW